MNEVKTRVDRSTRYFFGALLLPVFFPYVGVLKGIDIQPNALLAMVAMILFVIVQKQVLLDRAWLATLAFSLLVVIFRFLFQHASGDLPDDPGLGFTSFAQTVFHLLSILAVFVVVSAGIIRPTTYYIVTIVGVYGAVALLQILVDESFGSALVYRGFQELASTGRGVRSLASEPAVFANILLVLSGFLMICAAQNKWSQRRFLASQLLVLMMSIGLAQSAYVILLQFAVFSLCVILVSKRLFVGFATIAVWVVGTYVLVGDAAGVRVFYILQTLIENPVLLYEQGAMLRVMNVPISIYGGILHGAFGAGFDPQHVVAGTVPALPGHPYYFEVADRNLGGLVEIFLRIGVASLPLILLFFAGVRRIMVASAVLGKSRVYIGLPVALVVFLTCFTYSSIGNPLIWMLFFYANTWAKDCYSGRPKLSGEQKSEESDAERLAGANA